MSPEARDRIIDDTLESVTAYPNEVIMSTPEKFVSGVLAKGKELGLTGDAAPQIPPAPPAKQVCPSCGWDITPGHKFCVECGSTLS